MTRCIGFGDTVGACENKVDCMANSIWCSSCNAKRMSYLDSQFKILKPQLRSRGDERP
jgi:hypothetical protein